MEWICTDPQQGFVNEQPEMAEVALVAIVLILALIGPGATELTFLDCSPEGGEEEVLQDGLVEAALFVLITIFGEPVAKQAFGGRAAKKFSGMSFFSCRNQQKIIRVSNRMSASESRLSASFLAPSGKLACRRAE